MKKDWFNDDLKIGLLVLGWFGLVMLLALLLS